MIFCHSNSIIPPISILFFILNLNLLFLNQLNQYLIIGEEMTLKKYLPYILHCIGSIIAFISAIIGGLNPFSKPGLVWNYAISIYIAYFEARPRSYRKMSKELLEDEYSDVKKAQLVKLLFTFTTSILGFITNDLSVWMLTSGWVFSNIGTEIERRRLKKVLIKK